MRNYETPIVDLIKVTCEDVIATSEPIVTPEVPVM